MECLLKSIFSRFGWILEAKLGCKIHPNRSDLAWRGVMARRGEAWRGVARRGVARRGVEGVKGLKWGLVFPLSSGPKGLALLKGVDLPRTQDPLRTAGLERLIATFLVISLPLFFASFFDAFLDRFLVDFPSQLGSQNRPKIEKNRSQDAFDVGFHF